MGVDQNQSAHELGMGERGAEAEVAALRHADQYRTVDAEAFQQRGEVIG